VGVASLLSSMDFGPTITRSRGVVDGLVVVALDLKVDIWRRHDGLVDILEGLIEWDEVADVLAGSMRARPDHIHEIDPHAVEENRVSVECEWDAGVENAHHKDRA